MSTSGVVVSGHHKASEAGAEILRRGGNAIDAAVAASAVLCVAVPHMSGIGGDCFALYYSTDSKRVIAVNGSGAAPARASKEHFRRAGCSAIPKRGPLSLSVCGLVDAWQAVLERFGTISLRDALAAAISLAREGVPIDVALQAFLAGEIYRELAVAFPALPAIFGPPGDRRLGERLRQEALAASLQDVAREGSRALYGGGVGRALIRDLEKAGALLTLGDLAAHATRFDEPLSVLFRGAQVHVPPPNSQGLALALLSGLWETSGNALKAAPVLEPDAFVRLKRIAFALRDRYVADPERSSLPPGLLEPANLEQLLAASRAALKPQGSGGGDTSTLVVMDRWGNAVSWAQSLFEEFGSGVVSPSTGIVMHDRLHLERLDEDAPFGLQPKARPFHTLCPALVVRDGCELAIATPGDHGQPQSIFQVLVNLYDGGMNVQEAVEAPRMRHDADPVVMVEDRVPADWINAIERAGLHAKMVGGWSRLMGGVNAIWRSGDGLLMAGADPRRASYAVSA